MSEIDNTWLKLNRMTHDLRRILIGETDGEILELHKALEIITKTADVLKKRIES